MHTAQAHNMIGSWMIVVHNIGDDYFIIGCGLVATTFACYVVTTIIVDASTKRHDWMQLHTHLRAHEFTCLASVVGRLYACTLHSAHYSSSSRTHISMAIIPVGSQTGNFAENLFATTSVYLCIFFFICSIVVAQKHIYPFIHCIQTEWADGN